MAKANVTIIEAQMGEGKTNTATAICVDRYFSRIHTIISPEGFRFAVKPYRLNFVELQPRPGIDEKPKIVEIPKGWKTLSDTKVFTNYHLYGVRFMYSDPAMMLQYLNTGLLSSGIMVIDEGYIAGDARRSMNTLGLIYTWFAQQMRKREIELYLLVQHGRFIDWRFRYVAKQKILTRYSDKTHRIRLLIQNLSKGTEKIVSFYAPTYWKYYDTNELPPVPEKMIQKGASWA